MTVISLVSFISGPLPLGKSLVGFEMADIPSFQQGRDEIKRDSVRLAFNARSGLVKAVCEMKFSLHVL